MTLAKNPVVVAFVNVAFDPMRFWRLVFPRTVKVLVTVEEEARKPPYRERVEVAKEPRAVTVARVSDSTDTGQFVPVWRQTAVPFTKTAAAFKVVPDAVEKPSQVAVAFVMEPLVMERLVVEALVAKRLVVVTLVPVAIVQVRP
jgi:hypothetical protein